MSKVNYLDEKDYNFIYSKVPRFCVDLVVKNKKGYLLSLRKIQPYKNKWHLCGGGVKFGETIKQAIDRIALKEMGVEVLIKKQIGYMMFCNEKVNGNKRHSVSIVFLVSPIGTPNGKYFKSLPKNMHQIHKQFLIENKI